jgi:thioesterase domain-containing protein
MQYASSSQLQQLQQALHMFVPLSQHAKISVCSYDGQSIRLAAPLAENLNPVGNVFAGSLHITLTLSGWGLIWFLLQELGLQASIVLYESACQYKRPVKQDFSALCYRPDEGQVEHFLKVIQRRKKGQLQVVGEVREDGEVAVAFTGRYAVHLLA